MRTTTVGIVCLVLVSAVSCQYALSPFVVKARDPLVSNHLKSQLVLDRRFFKYYEHVRNAATKAFAPIQAAKDDFNDAVNSVGPIPYSSPFATFNSTVNSMLDQTVVYGATYVLQSASMGMYGDLAPPARDLGMLFTNMMSSIMMIATANTYPGSTTPPKSDECIQETFDAAQVIYDSVVNASLTSAASATANVTLIQKEVTILSNAFKQLVGILSDEIRGCNQDLGCLEYFAYQYNNGDRNWLLQNLGVPPSQFMMRMSTITQFYPGYGSGSSDAVMKFYDLNNLCEPPVYN